MVEVTFNQSGAELRIQDGRAQESSTMLENNIEEYLGSVFTPTTSKSILTGSCGPSRSW